MNTLQLAKLLTTNTQPSSICATRNNSTANVNIPSTHYNSEQTTTTPQPPQESTHSQTPPSHSAKRDQKQSAAIKWLWLAALVVLLDQVSKYLIVAHLHFGQTVTLLPFLNFKLSINTGAAFGFLGSTGAWHKSLLLVIAAAAVLVLLYWLARLPRTERLTAAAICCIMGGALGNMLDRLQHGFVVDFIDFHVKNWHFATFNLADAAISIGAALIILRTLLKPTRHTKTGS